MQPIILYWLDPIPKGEKKNSIKDIIRIIVEIKWDLLVDKFISISIS